MSLSSLILVGGQSSRMGTPKHTLCLPKSIETEDSQPLLIHVLLSHHHFQSSLNRSKSEIWISVRDESQKEAIENLLVAYESRKETNIHFVLDEYRDFGPAAGLLGAHAQRPNVSWLTTACDYPLLSCTILRQLYLSHIGGKAEITCFKNKQGFAEPLFAIWTPSALQLMATEAATAQKKGSSLGPSRIIRILQNLSVHHSDSSSHSCGGVNLVIPMDFSCLTNVNTPDEWMKVQNLVKSGYSITER